MGVVGEEPEARTAEGGGHRGAHEYVGEAYLIVNNLAKAEEHFAALQRICLIPCEEYEDLKKAVAAYRQRTGT